MTSERQISANRLNARRSTGPKSQNGKLRTRQNAIRHGLTAETVIGVLEDPEEFRAFETALLADYSPQTEIERALINRLASLLWRLRRAVAIETGLFDIQREILRERNLENRSQFEREPQRLSNQEIFPGSPSEPKPFTAKSEIMGPGNPNPITDQSAEGAYRDLARCFLRLSNLESGILDRIDRYESTLWRNAMRTIMTFETVRARAKNSRGLESHRSDHQPWIESD